MARLFFSYSHADEALRDQLERQLAMLKRQGIIEAWHDRRIGAGNEWATAIDNHVETDDIILLLVSPDFLASDYCYDREMNRALERHDAGEAIVIPVILRPCDWHHAPFGKLQAVPTDGKPVTLMPNTDAALLEVAQAVRDAAGRLTSRAGAQPAGGFGTTAVSDALSVPARSSNLRLAKSFTDRDKDRFLLEAFEYLARFFESSLIELGNRNPGVEGHFRRVDANRFTAAVYRHGKAEARCTIFMSSGFGSNSIGFAHGETDQSNSFNEQLTVGSDDQALFLSAMGMAFHGRGRDEQLSLEGAAELYWSIFISPLQQR
ncbi:toll/interleukin-1 receptor domain-containing protein [Sphingomonas sp. GCM10030256]|uniref:toll/interleukin-1 receptor domain-containing protein n=1 Tax=Sphingomonas sp. GCM10030256 TaxID=3273427 RepID=UPI003618AB02